jgi:transketolase
LAREEGELKLILIATGSEVGLAIKAREQLQAENIGTRVVSMPCWEFFEEQSQTYRDEVLPPQTTARLAIEAGVRQGWDRWIGSNGDTITQDRFGLSAPAADVFKEFGFTVENAVAKAKKLI